MSQTTPLLRSGDRLTRVEFERRYSSMKNTRAELIDGVVYVDSRVSDRHGGLAAALIGWLGTYASRRPELRLLSKATVRLDEDNEPQPDACVIRSDHVREDGFLKGAPLFVAEAAYSSASYDLHQKKELFRRYSCQEYLVAVEHSQEVYWFRNVEGRFEPIAPKQPGIYESVLFPGLVLDANALFAEDLARLLGTLEDSLKKLGP